MRIKLHYICLLVISMLSCHSGKNDNLEITYSLKRGDFLHTIVERGELEAKKSIPVMTPQLGWRMLKIAWLILEGSIVKKGDVVLILESQEVQTEYQNAIDELEIARAELQKREAELTLERLELESRIKNDEATVEVSRFQLAKLKFEPENKQEIERLKIENTEVELNKNRNKLISLQKIQPEERTRLQLKIKQAQNKLEQSSKYLDQLTLCSPVDGFVIYSESWFTGEKIQEGGMAWPNMSLVKIPDLSTMQVKLQLGETDAQKIQKGQPATITIPSIDSLAFSGKVSQKGKMAKPIRRRSKIKKVETLPYGNVILHYHQTVLWSHPTPCLLPFISSPYRKAFLHSRYFFFSAFGKRGSPKFPNILSDRVATNTTDAS